MKLPLKITLTCVALILAPNVFALPELPFCPAGGPTGWFNYFDYKKDQKRWRRQYYYPLALRPTNYYYQPGYYRSQESEFYIPNTDTQNRNHHR